MPLPKPPKPPRTDLVRRPRSMAPAIAPSFKLQLNSREVRRKYFVFSINGSTIENYLFYACVEQYRNDPSPRKALCLFRTFVVAGSRFEVNLPSAMRDIAQD